MTDACSPQRYLANNRNAVLDAELAPSDVEAVAGSVYEIPTARSGTAQVALSGDYTGEEEAAYDVQIVDDDVDEALISAPIFSGVGSGSLSDISSEGPAQKFTVSLKQTGLPLRAASVDFEGVTLEARTGGAAGNAITIEVDQSPLIFEAQDFSLLAALPAGSGSQTNPLEGAEFDFDAAVIGADDQIPTTAHRIAFGHDTSAIYLQYKKYSDGKWLYYFVPELKREVPAGAIIKFVTGGRTVSISNGGPAEEYEDVVTLYDLLNQIKNESVLLTITDPVANDRSPAGQAARELLTRTDAHFEPSSGSGSEAARGGFVDVSVDPAAGTELIEATCVAVSPADDPLASAGRERWTLRGSLSGDLGVIVTGIPFANDDFGLTIPRVLPFNFGTQRGRFTHVRTDYVTRVAPAEPPPICPVALTLGPAAVDQTITLTYTKRPSGACLCADMPVPNLATECLGIISEGGADEMAYSSEAITRLKLLYDLAAGIADQMTRYKQGFARDGIPDQSVGYSDAESTVNNEVTGAISPGASTSEEISAALAGAANLKEFLTSSAPVVTWYGDAALPPNFQECIDFYEEGLKAIDELDTSGLKADGFEQWDEALTVLETDILGSGSPPIDRLATMAITKYKILVRQAMAYAGIPQLGKSEASTVTSGDGCWRDTNDPFYWTVVGSANGAYAPLFNNTPYYSSRRASERAAYYSTHEFALQLNIKCPQNLLEGDEITLVIGGSGWASTYQISDKMFLPIIAASALLLAGGQDESLVQSWFAEGSITGPLPSYSFDPDAPVPYSSGDSPQTLAFTLNEGGIPFANGDRFEFSSEGGHFRWRKDAGAWSSPIVIPGSPLLLDEGLSVAFTTGASPSFVADDVFRFRALQPWAVSNLQSPTPDRWQWGATTAPSLVIDFGSLLPVDAVAIALHTLPEGATALIEFGTSPGVYTSSVSLAWSEGVMFSALVAQISARYARLSLGAADGGGIGWLWIGSAFATTRQAEVRPRRKYAVSRATAGLYTGGRYLGKARGADVEWKEGALYDADMVELEELLDHVKSNDDEPLVFVPNVTRPEEAMIVQVVEDEIELADTSDSNRLAGLERRFTARLSLAGVLQ
jgi:hypothetical protein